MRIIIYTRNNCVQCHATKRAMESRGFDFEMVNVDLQPDLADNLRDQGFRQLPVVVAGETSWSGFRPDMINVCIRNTVWPAHESARLLLQQLRKYAPLYAASGAACHPHSA